MLAQSGVELAWKLAVAYAGRTTIVFDSCRAFDVVAD